MKPAGCIERTLGWVAGSCMILMARSAKKRGDRHELAHIWAALEAGNTSARSHRGGCVLMDPVRLAKTADLLVVSDEH